MVCGAKAEPPPAELDGVPARTLAAARGESWDVAVATWWTTAAALHELDARRRAALLLNVEHRFYRPGELADLTAAAAVLTMPVDYLCIAGFMFDLLADLRPDARVFLVRPGIDKAVFTARERTAGAGPLRVLVEGQPTLWFKQVREAIAAVRGMEEPASVTLVVQRAGDGDDLGADRVECPAEPEAMAALYAEHDVQLKLPHFEGLGLPPIEGFHTGLPCVATPFTASEEFMEHGVNGLVVGFDDPASTSRALDLLAHDPALRERLARGALATAGRWPDREASVDTFAKALEAIAAEAPPEPDLAHAARLERLRAELIRERDRGLAGALAWSGHELADARSTLSDTTDKLHTMQFHLANVVESRAYRTGLALRRLAFWRRSR